MAVERPAGAAGWRVARPPVPPGLSFQVFDVCAAPYYRECSQEVPNDRKRLSFPEAERGLSGMSDDGNVQKGAGGVSEIDSSEKPRPRPHGAAEPPTRPCRKNALDSKRQRPSQVRPEPSGR